MRATDIKQIVRRHLSSSLSGYYGEPVPSPKSVYDSDQLHLVEVGQINDAAVLMVLYLGLPGGSIGDLDLYKLLQQYIRSDEARKEINVLLTKYH